MKFPDVDRKRLVRLFTSAYFEARKGKLLTRDENLFEMNWSANISLLVDEILRGEYQPARGIAFIIEKPVVREIFAAAFRDRVVHHFLYNMCASWWDNRLIYNSSSCRKHKGTLFGIERLEHDIRSVSRNGSRKAYIIKLDIQGYFMSLPRRELYKIVCWGLKRQFPNGGSDFRLLKYLWKKIIFDDPVRGVRIRPPVRRWHKLPETKSLFYQPDGKGIVIGNLSSQHLSNAYLDRLDRYVTMELGHKHYGRYVDDFYMVVTEEEFHQALRDIKKIEDFLRRLGLTLHPKKRYIQSVDKGVEFLGVMVYPFNRVASRRFKNSLYVALRSYAEGHGSNEMLESYVGYCSHFRSKKLLKKAFLQVGWDFGLHK